MDNKYIFASNLKKYMEANGKSRREVCEAIGVSYYTFTDWVNAKKYPRMDKIEKLAAYFGILKSDLIEEHDNAPTPKDEREDVLDEVDVAFYGEYKELDEEQKATIRDMVAVMRSRKGKRPE